LTRGTKQKTKVGIFVAGFGCDGLRPDTINQIASKWSIIAGFQVHVVCPHKQAREATTRPGLGSRVLATLETTRSVLTALCNNKKLDFNSSVVVNLWKMVQSLIQDHHLVVIGHSYGGSVVSRLIDYIETINPSGWTAANLEIYTVGTIQLPIKKSLSQIHFLNDGDISAWTCLDNTERSDVKICIGGKGHTQYDDVITRLFRGIGASKGGRSLPRFARPTPRRAVRAVPVGRANRKQPPQRTVSRATKNAPKRKAA
jgi:hypothetical protein